MEPNPRAPFLSLLFPPPFDSPSLGRCEQPARPSQGPGGLLWPWYHRREWGNRGLARGTRKPLSPGAPFAAGAPRRGGALPGARGHRSPVEPGGGEGGGPAACENCYFSSITRNLCKCPGQDTSRPAGWGHGDNTAMEKSKLHLLTSSQIQITALAWRGEGSERSM